MSLITWKLSRFIHYLSSGIKIGMDVADVPCNMDIIWCRFLDIGCNYCVVCFSSEELMELVTQNKADVPCNIGQI